MSTMPLGRRRRADEIAEQIERAISTGEFKEGAPMPSEKELSERFAVGRPSVRQALFILQQQGLVEITSGDLKAGYKVVVNEIRSGDKKTGGSPPRSPLRF